VDAGLDSLHGAIKRGYTVFKGEIGGGPTGS
jgi:hypothetical protein